jgi:dTMP kinase
MMPQSQARLISIEGGEGAGKSSVMETLRDALSARGIDVVSTREPGGTDVGEAIRSVLLDPARMLSAETELLLMFAARAQLVREVIRPALAHGTWVITDRFTDASYAYQGGGRGIDSGRIAELERWAAAIKPDLTFLLDVDVAQGHARIADRGEPDRIERERAEFFQHVRATYLSRARLEPKRFRVIDAGAPPDVVVRAVLVALDQWLAEHA